MSASSLTVSASTSLAPWRAAATSGTPFSSST